MYVTAFQRTLVGTHWIYTKTMSWLRSVSTGKFNNISPAQEDLLISLSEAWSRELYYWRTKKQVRWEMRPFSVVHCSIVWKMLSGRNFFISWLTSPCIPTVQFSMPCESSAAVRILSVVMKWRWSQGHSGFVWVKEKFTFWCPWAPGYHLGHPHFLQHDSAKTIYYEG